MQARMTVEEERRIEERFDLQREALGLLEVIVAEWDSDPMSVQCFDLRIVARAKQVAKRLRELQPL